MDNEHCGGLLIPTIMTKLPNKLCLRIARETDKQVWEIKELLAIIKKEVEAREATEYVKIHQAKGPNQNKGPRMPPQLTPTASALVTSGSSVRCVYCNDGHYSASCGKIRSAQERKSILIKTGRCFNCLRINHKSYNCQSTKTCRLCNRKHHQSICENSCTFDSNSMNRTPTDSLPTRPTEQPASNSVSNSGTGQVTTSTTTSTKNHKTVLLQTAHAMALANPNGPFVPACVLFDSGSQLSYVTERLQKELHLKIERLHLNTFGCNDYKTQECAVVSLYLQGYHGRELTRISALISPSICSPLPSIVRVSNYPHLQDLPLADKCDTPNKR